MFARLRFSAPVAAAVGVLLAGAYAVLTPSVQAYVGTGGALWGGGCVLVFALLGRVPGALAGAAFGLLGAWYLIPGPPSVLYAAQFAALTAGYVIVGGAIGHFRDTCARTRAAASFESTLIGAASEALLVLDPETELIRLANPQAAALLGVADGALIGQSMRRYSTDPDRVQPLLERLLETHEPVQFESVQRRADGGRFVASVSASVLPYEGQEAILCIIRDVTARVAAERALRRSERHAHRLALVAEHTASGVFVASPEGSIEWCNAALARMAGAPVEELLGQRAEDVLFGPSTDPLQLLQLHAAVRQQTPFRGELECQRAGGGTFFASVEYQPLQEDETFSGYMGVLTDISARKAAEEALQTSEARHRGVMDSLTEVVFQLDEDGRWSFLNPAWTTISGYGVEESLGRTCFEFLLERDAEAAVAIFQDLAAQADGHYSIGPITGRVQRKDGQVRWVEMQARVTVLGQRIARAAGSITDTTDSRRYLVEREAREQAERARHAAEVARRNADEMARVKGALLTNVSHEIRTPLTGILGFARVLSDEVSGDAREMVEIIEDSARQLLLTLNGVLDLAQIEGGGIEVEPKAVALGPEVEHAIGQHRADADAAGLRLDAVAYGDVTAWVDRGVLQRVLFHLLSNAVKFTHQGAVRVEVGQHEDGGALVRVRDTGIGIDPAHHARIFEPFDQLDDGIDRAYEGTGIGLAITRRLVELMGGRISVESVPEVGSTFSVWLPSVPAGDGGDGQPMDAGAEIEDAVVEVVAPGPRARGQ